MSLRIPNRRQALAYIASIIGAAGTPSSWAQSAPQYPVRPVKMITGGSVGGTSDLMGRVIGERFAKAWGQPCVSEARPGANQSIAIKAVATDAPDGHALFLGTTAYTLNLALRKDAIYGPRDLIPLSHLATAPTVLAVSANLGVETLDQFLKLIRAEPGKYSYGSTGTGSAPHVNGEMLSLSTKSRLIHVPYKGESALVTDLVAGTIAAAYGTAQLMGPLAKAGKLKLLTVTGDKRLPALPDVPHSVELGQPMLTGYWGLWTTAGTPAATVRKIADETRRVIAIPEVAQQIVGMGFIPIGSGSEEFSTFLDAEFKRWKSAADATNISLKD